MNQQKNILISEIKRLSNELDSHYNSELNFRNHCYLRIAFDNTVGDKWNTKIAKPFIKYATMEQLTNVLAMLNHYLLNKQILCIDNERSLTFREKVKANEHIKNPKLF